MRSTAIFFLTLYLATNAFADRPRSAKHGFHTTSSPDHRHVLIQWIEDPDDVEKLRIHWAVNDAKSGNQEWHTVLTLNDLPFIPYEREVFLNTGGSHVVVTDRYIEKVDNGFEENPAVLLFHKGSKVNNFSLKELGIDRESILRSVSHLHAFPAEFDFRNPYWYKRDEKQDDKVTSIRIFGGNAESVYFTLRDSTRITINFRSGKIKKREKVEYRGSVIDLKHF